MIVRSSSARPWPETCTGALSSCSTSAPERARRLIASCTRSSFPGIGFAEMMTVSPASILTAGWSLYAMRVIADIGSPWLPVQRISCWFGGSSASSCGRRIASSGTFMYPRLRAMFAFFRIERPTNATLRPHSMPTSAACCMRCTFDANEETRILPVRLGKIWRNASPTTRSDCVTPARSAFVESPSTRSTPRLPSSASLPTSVRWPSTGVWSSL